MNSSRLIHAASLMLLLCIASGCNLLGYAASGIAGGEKSPAMFVPAKTPMVVIAEKFDNPADASLDAEPIARYTSEELSGHEVAPIVSSEKVASLQSANPARFRGMTIAAVGRAVGADQILYINIVSTSMEVADNSDMLRGRGEVRVRLVDANTGATIWPLDSADGYPINAETRMFRRADRNEASVRSDLHRMLAGRAARLFYVTKSE
ncbi:MAG: hypothetical protein H7Z14_09865 [Anaerolineae bacterium]|nr:hypothetical protein [Phycisphaerae bacterium]